MDLRSSVYPEGITSFLDTDLYKLTMQCAVLKWFPAVPVTYAFTNRTPDKKLSRAAFRWLQEQINKLGNISLTADELAFLKRHCPYLGHDYLEFLREFRLRPRDHVDLSFTPCDPPSRAGAGAAAPTSPPDDKALGDVSIRIHGPWVDTILYEIPILALTSEAYFRFIDTDWTYDGQEEQAFTKGMRLLAAGCVTSEFGTRRRRDYHTQALVYRGLVRAGRAAAAAGLAGRLAGTSNVHLAMRFDTAPIGTVAHEWFMGIAALTADYRTATATALRHWVGTFGRQLGIALTDTFGTEHFLTAFSQPVEPLEGGAVIADEAQGRTYADFFSGVRQDSGDPATFVAVMARYYRQAAITDQKTIVFSDSLDVDKCLAYKDIAHRAGFESSFGVGTYLTNDFVNTKTGAKSTPLNIVIKLSSAGGRDAVKISDHIGKNTGDSETVQRVKQELGYVEREWEGGDEASRWGAAAVGGEAGQGEEEKQEGSKA